MNPVFEIENAREQMGVKDMSSGVSGLLAFDTQEWDAVCKHPMCCVTHEGLWEAEVNITEVSQFKKKPSSKGGFGVSPFCHPEENDVQIIG